MVSIRYKRFVRSVFRDLRRQHRLAHPNQWLGSAEQSVRRTDDVFRNQVQQTVKRMVGQASTATGQGSAAGAKDPGTRAAAPSRASAQGQSCDDDS